MATVVIPSSIVYCGQKYLSMVYVSITWLYLWDSHSSTLSVDMILASWWKTLVYWCLSLFWQAVLCKICKVRFSSPCHTFCTHVTELAPHLDTHCSFCLWLVRAFSCWELPPLCVKFTLLHVCIAHGASWKNVNRRPNGEKYSRKE